MVKKDLGRSKLDNGFLPSLEIYVEGNFTTLNCKLGDAEYQMG